MPRCTKCAIADGPAWPAVNDRKRFKVVLLAKEGCQVGGQGVDELLPLRPYLVDSSQLR